MRLDKLLAHMNCGSRKEVQGFIRTGRVTVDGLCVRDPAHKVSGESSFVRLDGVEQHYRKNRYYMLNKPAGVITANVDERHKTVMGLFPEKERRGLFAAGRLDKDTEGLLIITDDGAFSHKLMSPGKHVDKVYEAVIEGSLANDASERFRDGITLKDGEKCRPASLEMLECAPRSFVRVTVSEGKYHQVKRMLAAAGGKVVKLKRVSLGGLKLDESLLPGEYRELAEDEIKMLMDY